MNSMSNDALPVSQKHGKLYDGETFKCICNPISPTIFGKSRALNTYPGFLEGSPVFRASDQNGYLYYSAYNKTCSLLLYAVFHRSEQAFNAGIRHRKCPEDLFRVRVRLVFPLPGIA